MIKLTENDVLVTTPVSPDAEDKELALQLAGKIGISFCPRGKNTISYLTHRCNLSAAIVVSSKQIHLVCQGHRYGFHPNMSLQRVLALKKGEKDRLVEAAQLKSGDSVLDCTCGLGADAVISAYAVGERGRVRALESSALLATIVRFGLLSYEHKESALLDAMRRVAVVNQDYAEALHELDTNSWDVVCFDPMFEKSFSDTKGIDLVHLLGSSSLPSPEVIDQARRVASRSVVIKDRYPGNFLKTIGAPIVSNSKRIWYGRLKSS